MHVDLDAVPVVLTLQGRFSEEAAPRLARLLGWLLRQEPDHLVVDVERAGPLDPSAASLLRAAERAAETWGGRVEVRGRSLALLTALAVASLASTSPAGAGAAAAPSRPVDPGAQSG